MASGVVRIILEEFLGYNVVEHGPAATTLAGFYALTGCAAPNNITHPACDQPLTYNHIMMESWSEGYAKDWQQIQAQYPSRAPVDLGSIGYEGISGYFLPKVISDGAYNQDGVMLEYHRAWNASWLDSTRYFDTLDSVDRGTMVPCSRTVFMNVLAMQDYLRITGDSAGLQAGTNPDSSAKVPAS